MSMLFHMDLQSWISMLGYTGLGLIIFLETGLFFGVIFPGDSMIFLSGFLASTHLFNFHVLFSILVLSAFLGYVVAYPFGYGFVRYLLRRKESIFFKKAYLSQANDFYDRYGFSSLIIGRFIPVVRTFLPILAGMVHMPVGRYMLANAIGAILWAGGLSALGFYLGGAIPGIKHYISMVLVGVILVSIMPMVHQWLKSRRN